MISTKKCLICGTEENFSSLGIQGGIREMSCRICGTYGMTDSLIATLNAGMTDLNKKFTEIAYLLSGYSREMHEIGGEPPRYTSDLIDNPPQALAFIDPEDLDQKVLKLLQRIKDKTHYFGEDIELIYQNDYPLAYAKNADEFSTLLRLLREMGLITLLEETNVSEILELSAHGMERLREAERSNKSSHQGFIAVWFDDSMNDSIKAMSEAIREANFQPLCLRGEHFSLPIMDKALGEIRRSRFVVADLTGARNSVLFEVGFAFGLGIEIIYVYHEDAVKSPSPLDFYVKHYQCHAYKDAAALKEIVKNAINARIGRN